MTKQLRVMAMVIFILAICTVTVSAYDSEENKTKIAQDVTEETEEQNIEENTEDEMASNENAEEGEEAAREAIPVIVNLDGVPRMVTTQADTIGEVLAEISDDLGTGYLLENADEEDLLTENATIELKSMREEISTVTESIPYTTEYRDNADLEYGTQRVVQEGVEGLLEISYKDVYVGSRKEGESQVSTRIVREPVNAIVEKGTAQTVETAAGLLEYTKALNVKATGYTPNDPGCTGITATGIEAKRGVVAVDPDVIPMGTKLYIPGYGHAVAADTGGAIKGHKIDLCYDTVTEAYQWGVRNVTVYIVE